MSSRPPAGGVATLSCELLDQGVVVRRDELRLGAEQIARRGELVVGRADGQAAVPGDRRLDLSKVIDERVPVDIGTSCLVDRWPRVWHVRRSFTLSGHPDAVGFDLVESAYAPGGRVGSMADAVDRSPRQPRSAPRRAQDGKQYPKAACSAVKAEATRSIDSSS